jgi:hypothetical protein
MRIAPVRIGAAAAGRSITSRTYRYTLAIPIRKPVSAYAFLAVAAQSADATADPTGIPSARFVSWHT